MNGPRRSTLLDTNEAAAYLHISPRTLEGWRVRGGGPVFVKLGRRVLYDEYDLEEFVDSARRESTSDPGSGSTR